MIRRFFKHMFAGLDWTDIIERALWTGVESFAGAIPIGSLIFGAQGWELALGSFLTAVIGTLASTLKNIAKQKLAEG